MRSGSRVVAAGVLGALITIAGGCAGSTTGVTPSATVTTAILGWESRMSLDWEVTGQDIAGYVNNRYGSHFINVQILAQGLDAGGNVVGHKLEWVQGIVPAHQRTYFRIPNMPPAARYRVSVWAFDSIESVNFL